MADEVARPTSPPSVPVGPHLADQLVLLLALARGGSFRTTAPTLHTRTQLDGDRALPGHRESPRTEEATGRWHLVASPTAR